MDWDQAYRTHHAEVFRYLYYRTGNRELAADLTHDVFVRAIKAQDRFTDDGRGLGPWLATIARNLLVDHYRAPRRQREDLVDTIADDQLTQPSAESAVLTTVDVLRAVAGLEVEQREAVLLSYWADLPDAQIAARMGCNTRTVNTRRYRAREVLRRRLAGVAA